MKNLILFLIAFACSISPTTAQWVQTNGPHTTLSSLTINGSNIFAGATGPGVYRSDIIVDNWTLVNSGLTNLFIEALASKDTLVFAGSAGFFISGDSGDSWAESHDGINLFSLAFHSIAIKGDSIYAGLAGGLYLSTDNGDNWTQFTNGIPVSIDISSIVYKGDTIFFGTRANGGSITNGVFTSTNNGASWTKMNTGLADSAVRSLALCGNRLLAGTDHHGVFSSSDNGLNWVADTTVGMGNLTVNALASYNNYVFAGTNNGVFISDDSGTTWRLDTLQHNLITAFTISSSYIYLASNQGGIWKRSLSEFTTLPEIYISPMNINIFPNPVDKKLTISSNISNGPIEISIMNILGDLLQREKLTFSISTNINVIQLPAGIYFLQLKSKNGSVVKMFVKE